jgi:hypothetical protein
MSVICFDRGQKIMRFANNVGDAGPHVRQTFLNDVFTFLTEVGNAGRKKLWIITFIYANASCILP